MDPVIKEQEAKHIKIVGEQIKESKAFIENTLKAMGAENLDLLKGLRADSETGADFFFLMEQLHEKNEALNIKDRFKRLEEMEFLLKEPYFARMDLVNPADNSSEKIYIGKFGFSTDVPVVTDWRAPIASVYYRYRYPQKNVAYNTPLGQETRDLALKRTYEIFDGDLVKYYNNDIQLDENEIIVDKIEQRTGGVLEDIVETIQKDQMDIIEADPRQICIVQGCVGSGKSTVAIHKLAHIFFNFPTYIHPEKSILVAKNQILVGYLSTLFPKLGIFDINYKTLRDLIVNVLFREELHTNVDMDADQDTSKYDVVFLNKLNDRINSVHKKIKDRLEMVFMNPDYESYASYKYSDKNTPYENLSEIIGDLTEEIDTESELIKADPKSIKSLMYKDNIKNIRRLSKELITMRQELKAKILSSLLKEYNINLNGIKKLTYSQTLLYLFIYQKLIGVTKFQPYEYCVVDEAQDFSVLEYAVLSMFVLRGRFGIFGDLNQSLEDDGVSTWDDIKSVINEANNALVFKLTTNFRSTKPIIDLANKILYPFTQNYLPNSINRRGEDPLIVTTNSEDEMFEEFKKNISEDLKDINKSIGIICFDQELMPKVGDYLSQNIKDLDMLIKLDATKKISYIPKGVYYMNTTDCKGLEFAKVYVLGLNFNKIKNYSIAKRAFVAVTRAMNELHVYGNK